MIVDFPASRIARNKYLLFVSPPVWSILSWQQPEQPKTPTDFLGILGLQTVIAIVGETVISYR